MFSPDQCRIRPSRAALWARRQISDSFFLLRSKKRRERERIQVVMERLTLRLRGRDEMIFIFFLLSSFQLEHSWISGWHVAITSVNWTASCHRSFSFVTVASSRHLLNLIVRRISIYWLTAVTVIVYTNAWIVFIIRCRSSRQTGYG